jgi:hypothetical protein
LLPTSVNSPILGMFISLLSILKLPNPSMQQFDCVHATTKEPQNRFWQNLISYNFMKIVWPFQFLSGLDNLENFNNYFTWRSTAVCFKLFGLWNPFQDWNISWNPHPWFVLAIGKAKKIVDHRFVLLVGK